MLLDAPQVASRRRRRRWKLQCGAGRCGGGLGSVSRQFGGAWLGGCGAGARACEARLLGVMCGFDVVLSPGQLVMRGASGLVMPGQSRQR